MVNIPKRVDQFPDWINLILAALLFISPWVLGFVDQTNASWNAWICGIIIAALAVSAIVRFAEWEEWINALLGVWVVVSPWILGFSAVLAAVWSHVILGVLIAALACWRGWSAHHGETRAPA